MQCKVPSPAFTAGLHICSVENLDLVSYLSICIFIYLNMILLYKETGPPVLASQGHTYTHTHTLYWDFVSPGHNLELNVSL